MSRRSISLPRFNGESMFYTFIPETDLNDKLALYSHAQTIGKTHCVSFQPNVLEGENQDRYVVREFTLSDGSVWKFRALFDGHIESDTVNHAVEHLPRMIHDRLSRCSSSSLDRDSVSSMLAEAIKAYDDSLLEDLLSIAPQFESESQLSRLTDEEIQNIIHNMDESRSKITRCMCGTTVVVALTSPGNESLWVASLGDSYAILGVQLTPDSTEEWETVVLSSHHNGQNPGESQRLIQGHPDEPEVVYRNRVLGQLALTRALGDHPYKLPRVYTERVFCKVDEMRDYRSSLKHWVLPRIITPPYVSNISDVRYFDLKSKRSQLPHREFDDQENDYKLRLCLLMCTDGLLDLFQDESEYASDSTAIFRRCMEVASARSDMDHQATNPALMILRDALGEADVERVSAMMTVEMYDKWMDDTTVLFEEL
ncbi:phosphatase 2C-like domain-containing protein [Lentinula raphanica]|uniref:Phosphatase 2C-like domain-containing protein n=1 Tax=Lentinula raphanica TaxID=153919 RepID=A0AA38P2L6_9AGAR|nr:phosphatase 2C-like domain-containing protein [Lentinula raphanica]